MFDFISDFIRCKVNGLFKFVNFCLVCDGNWLHIGRFNCIIYDVKEVECWQNVYCSAFVNFID